MECVAVSKKAERKKCHKITGQVLKCTLVIILLLTWTLLETCRENEGRYSIYRLTHMDKKGQDDIFGNNNGKMNKNALLETEKSGDTN